MSNSSAGTYRLIGQIRDGDQVEIRSDSRDNIRHYASIMMLNKAYLVVQVEAGGKIWSGEAIGRMP